MVIFLATFSIVLKWDFFFSYKIYIFWHKWAIPFIFHFLSLQEQSSRIIICICFEEIHKNPWNWISCKIFSYYIFSNLPINNFFSLCKAYRKHFLKKRKASKVGIGYQRKRRPFLIFLSIHFLKRVFLSVLFMQ